ncbi:MAG: GLUG motif-containing protein, partial [Eubacteriales bacterium]
MKKRLFKIYYFCFALIFIVFSFPIVSFAEVTDRVDEIPDYYKNNFIAISTPEEFNDVRKDLDGNYYLANDIIFTDEMFALGGEFYNNGAGFNPIGEDFSGVFDGMNYSIVGLLSNSRNAGVFKCVSGKVTRLNIVNYSCSIITASNNCVIGGIASSVIGPGSISYCNTSGQIELINSNGCVGGIVGEQEFGSVITKCFSSIDIICQNESGDMAQGSSVFGGISGMCSGKIDNCGYIGNISKNKIAEGGSIPIQYDNIGGIAGSTFDSISYCYFAGTITYPGDSYGTAGYVSATLYRCFSINSVMFNNKTHNGTCDTYSLTESQMKNPLSYIDWDFINVWEINNNISFPTIRKCEQSEMGFSGGNGSKDTPYLITSKYQLLNMSGQADVYFNLCNDIEFDETDTKAGGVLYELNFYCECLDDNDFKGIFDGCGYSIKGINYIEKG